MSKLIGITFILSILLFFFLFGCFDEPTKVSLPQPETAVGLVPSMEGYANIPITNEIATGVTALGFAASKVPEPNLVVAGEITKKLGIFLECYKMNNGVEIQLISAENDIADISIIAVGEENLYKIVTCVGVSPPMSVVGEQKTYGIYFSKCRIKDKSTWDIVTLSSVKETIKEINNKIPGCSNTEITEYVTYTTSTD